MSREKDSFDDFFDNGLDIKSRTLYLVGDEDESVDFKMSERLIKGLHLLNRAGKEEVTLYVNSDGGCFYNTLAIYEAIRASRSPVKGLVYGVAMSGASILLQACHQRGIGKNSLMMIHFGHGSLDGNPGEVASWAKESARQSKWMVEAYYARMKAKRVTRPRIEAMLKTDTILTATESMNLGLVDFVF